MKRKILCVLLSMFMMLAIVTTGTACGDGEPGGDNNKPPPNNNNETRTITIGTWFDRYYVSKHTKVEDDPNVDDPILAQMQLDNMRAIEEKYNIKLDYINLTWTGIQESIGTSIMAGIPDVDVYQVDLQFGIPAVLSNLAISLESMGLQDTDVFNDKLVAKALNLNQPERTYLFTSSLSTSIDIYPLAFNMDMIREKNLENPQDLWDKGEWTWGKWREYLTALTDPERGIYGWSGYWTNMLHGLIFSNGTTVASGPQTTVTDSKTIEVFQLIYDIYNSDRTGRPWDETKWENNNTMYAQGLSGFWVGADWIFSEQGGGTGPEVPFEIGVVPWPVGPNGNKDTNRHGVSGGNWYFIPIGVENPRLVYDVMYDWMNWYDYDRETAVDMEWCRNQYMTDRNFDLAFMMDQNTGFDLWNTLGITGPDGEFSMIPIMDGEMNASSYAESVRQVIQDALDGFFKP